MKLRKQCVIIEGHKSEKVWTISGVPQGSVLGPLLFLIMMVYISKGINYAILSFFADDTKAWRRVVSVADETNIQSDLDHIYLWASQNNMEFNNKKFQAIRFHDFINPPEYISPDGSLIKHESIVKDLGIHISQDLSFEYHIRLVAKKANRWQDGSYVSLAAEREH